MKQFEQDPTDPAFVQDPYAAYARARAEGAILYWPAYGMPAAFSHETVDALLRDRRLGREAPAGALPAPPERLAPFYRIEDNSMLELEGKRHARLRGLVMRAFTSSRVAALRAPIHALCMDLCTDIAERLQEGPVDVLDAYCRPLPVTIIARLLGVPDTDADQLLAWSNAMVGMYQAGRTRAMEDAAAAASTEFAAYLQGPIAQKRQSPKDDLFSALIAARDAQDKLSEAELIATAILLLNAGHEATVHALGNTIAAVLRTGHRGNWDNIAEEGMRYDPPLHLFTRWVYEDVEIAGVTLPAGSQVACMLGAAARDPEAWPNPDSFSPERFATRTAAQTAFGAGRHFCIGAPLARLEMAIALEVLFEQLPDLALAAPVQYAPIYHFHGLSAVQVRQGG